MNRRKPKNPLSKSTILGVNPKSARDQNTPIHQPSDSQQWSFHAMAYPIFFLVIGAIYLVWMPRSVTMEDSGEFLLTSQFFGISHPPGYPLYTILGHLFQYLPFSNPAVAMHCLSITFALTTLFLLLRFLHLWTGDKTIALISVISLASTPVFASNAITAEVYMLNTLLFMICLSSVEAMRQKFSTTRLAIVGVVLGLSLTNHWPLMILALPALVIRMDRKHFMSARNLSIFLVSFCLGLLPYLSLYYLQNQSLMIFLAPFEHVREIIPYIFRSEYSAIEENYRATLVDELRFFGLLTWNLTKSYYGIGFILIAAGLMKGPKMIGSKRFMSMLLILLSSSIALRIFWRNSFTRHSAQWYEYLNINTYLAASIALGIGIKFLSIKFPKQRKLILLTLAGLASLSFVGNRFYYSEWPDSFANDYAKLVLENLPENSVLMVKSDADAGPISYLHYGENLRQDLRVVSQVSALLPGKPFSRSLDIPSGDHRLKLLNYISSQKSKGRRVFLTARSDYFDSISLQFPYKLVPYGLYLEVSDQEFIPNIPQPLIDGAQKLIDDYLDGKYSRRYISLREELITTACDTLFLAKLDHRVFSEVSSCALVKAQRLSIDHQDYLQADKWFQSALLLSRDLSPKTQSFMMRQKLLNTLKLIGQMPQNQADSLLVAAVAEASEYALKWPDCSNQLGINLVEIQRQKQHLPIDSAHIRQAFGSCSSNAK